MSDLEDLGRHIEQELSAAEERRQATDDAQRRSIIEFQRRHEYFTTTADHVMHTVIRPRMDRVAACFRHARLPAHDEASKHRCLLHLGHTLRFPAAVRLELAVSHDAPCETLLVLSDLEIFPVFFPFEGRAQFSVPLGRVDDDRLAAWVDDGLVSFLRTYLRVEAADQYDAKDMVTDPVCGVRINRHYAAGRADYAGEAYYFCVENCLKKFVTDPRQYLAGVDLPDTAPVAPLVDVAADVRKG